MRDRRPIAVALALIAAGVAVPATAQTLSDAYRAALSRDPDWLGATEDAAAAGEGAGAARALFRPKVGVQASATYTRTDINAELPPVLQDVVPLRFSGGGFDGTVQVQQSLIDGAAAAQARQLRAGAKAADAQRDGARQQLMVRVADAYFAVMAARDEIASLEAQQHSAQREQRAAQARFDVGQARITDVREAQARGDGAAAQLVAATARRDVATARFAELTGLGETAVGALREDVVPQPPAQPLAAWQQDGEARSPAVIARTRALDAARAAIDRYGWGAQVKVDAVGSYTRLQRAGGDDRLPFARGLGTGTVGVRLQMPLYSGGGLQAQQREAAANARSAQQAVDAARRDVRLNVQQAWVGQASGVSAISALRTALASALLQERAAITGREVGVRTQADVLAAQAQTIDLRRQLADAVRQYETSRISLHAAAGSLDEAGLAEIDRDLATR